MKRSADAACFILLSILALPACLLLVTPVAFLALGGLSVDASFGARAVLGSIAMLFTLPAWFFVVVLLWEYRRTRRRQGMRPSRNCGTPSGV
jgi:hypothetical protein